MFELFRSSCCLAPVSIKGQRFICSKCGYTCDAVFEQDNKKKIISHPKRHKMVTGPQVAKTGPQSGDPQIPL